MFGIRATGWVWVGVSMLATSVMCVMVSVLTMHQARLWAAKVWLEGRVLDADQVTMLTGVRSSLARPSTCCSLFVHQSICSLSHVWRLEPGERKDSGSDCEWCWIQASLDSSDCCSCFHCAMRPLTVLSLRLASAVLDLVIWVCSCRELSDATSEVVVVYSGWNSVGSSGSVGYADESGWGWKSVMVESEESDAVAR